MVVRTNFNAATRGGACTTAFRLADLSRRHLDFGGGIPLPLEAVQENLRRFLIAVVPAAEAAGVKLAMHPDDPPLSPIAGFARIMSSVDSFDWLLELHSSPMNGLTLCAGCFGELGVSVPQLVRRFGSRIHFVHLRNIRGSLVDFIETFPDDGDVDLVGTLAALDGIGFDGYARPDHAPLLGTEAPEVAAGYGFEGHLFTVGYLRGVLAGLERGRAA
jgi:mannonate dehydratase